MAARRKNDIKWSKTKYNLKKFTKNYQMPQIVHVISGWCGVDEHETISSGQILRVGRKFTQLRVIAEDELGRHISIPVSYRFKFNVLTASDDINKTYTMEEILSGFTLPQKIQLAKDDGMFVSVDGTQRPDYPFGVLKLLKTHEISYLACNSMNAGGIVKQPLILPMYITIEVAVADGLVNGTKKQWEDFQRLRTKMVESNVNLEDVSGNEDISIYGSTEVSVKRKANLKEPMNIYEEIEPKIIRISTVKDSSAETQQDAATSAAITYDNVLPVPEQTPPRPPSVAKDGYTSLVSELSRQYEIINRPSVASRPVPPVDESQYDVIGQEGERRPPVPPKPGPGKPTPLPPASPSHPSGDGPSEPQSVTPAARAIPPRPPVQAKTAKVPPVQTEPSEGVASKFPDDVRGLSVDSVCDCLRALNLGQYAKDFKDNDVDGDFLTDLTEEIMRKELGMTQLHAKKLFKFVKGWRPNLGK